MHRATNLVDPLRRSTNFRPLVTVSMSIHLRIARPVSNLARSCTMYCQGLGLDVIGRFRDHDGFDGVMVGQVGADYHFEFTYCRTYPVIPAPTPEDLVVFYISEPAAWHDTYARMRATGFLEVASFNPYWDRRGRTLEDLDGYRVVLQRADWCNEAGG